MSLLFFCILPPFVLLLLTQINPLLTFGNNTLYTVNCDSAKKIGTDKIIVRENSYCANSSSVEKACKPWRCASPKLWPCNSPVYQLDMLGHLKTTDIQKHTGLYHHITEQFFLYCSQRNGIFWWTVWMISCSDHCLNIKGVTRTRMSPVIASLPSDG